MYLLAPKAQDKAITELPLVMVSRHAFFVPLDAELLVEFLNIGMVQKRCHSICHTAIARGEKNYDEYEFGV